MATSTVETPRCRDSRTASRDREVARWFWAIAQMAPLSLALLMRLPVLIRAWVVVSSLLVALRFCSATIAPMLVLTLFGISSVLHFRTGRRSGRRRAFCPARSAASLGPTEPRAGEGPSL